MADWAARYADRSADELRDRIRAIYLQAGVELQQKMQDFAQRSADRDAYMRQRVADGKMTPEQYRRWQQGQVFTGRQWQQKVRDATQAYVDADRIAGQLVNGVTHGVFVEAANYTAYHIERTMGGGVAFNLYDESTVERLLLDDPKMLPEWRIDRQKDYTWNEQRVRNAVAQGIIQGESVRQIGQRLCVGLATGNAAKMNMFARTAVTGAQNAGRVERLREAQDMGIQVRKVWLATLDERTREEHADLDGQERDIDKPFETSGYTIDYPGDPDAAPEMVYNCRCTLIYSYPRHRSDPSPRYDQQEGEVIDDTNYARWWESKHPGQTWEQHMQEHREGRGRAQGGGEETAQETARGIFDRTKGISDEFKRSMAEVLQNCGEPLAQRLFAQYAGELVCLDDRYGKTAHFTRFGGGVNMDTAKIAAGDRLSTPFETAFHEFGHMIDWLAGGQTSTYLSNTPVNGERLLDVIKRDFQTFKRSLGVSRAADVIPILWREGLSARKYGNVSDILEKCTGKSYPLGVGHGVEYHRREGATEKEFFAEVLDSAIANREAYDQMVRMFPNAVDMVWDMVRGVVE